MVQQDKLCEEAIKMLRNIHDFIISLDAEKYDHRTEDQKNTEHITNSNTTYTL